jgi:hypothetical protein
MKTFKALILIILVLNICFAYGQNCVQCDPNCTIGNDYSSALGKSNTSTGEASLAAGKNSTASNFSSISLGNFATASGSAAMVFGQYLSASGANSIVIGKGGSPFSALSNSNASSLMIGFGSTKPTLFVGTASSSSKTGKIGIGDVTSPSAKLHIKADDAEDAAIFIQPYAWNSGKWAEIQLGNSSNKIRSSYSYGFEFSVSGGNYLFNNGKVGIGTGTNTPLQCLEIAHYDSTIKSGIALNNKNPSVSKLSQIYFMKNSIEKWAIGNDIHRSGAQDFFIWDHQNGAVRFIIDPLGRTGIGTAYPEYKLDIGADTLNGLQVKTTHGTTNYGYCIRANVDNNTTKALVVDKSDTTNFIVYGDGSVRAREIYVKLGSLGDFVFNDDYKLKSISQLENYIETTSIYPGFLQPKKFRKTI